MTDAQTRADPLSPQAVATCAAHYPRCGRCTIAGACHQRVAGGAEALQDWRRQVNAAAEVCPCFPGVCRGGQVVGGRLANGQRCREAGR